MQKKSQFSQFNAAVDGAVITLTEFAASLPFLHLRDRHVDAEIAVVGEELSYRCVEHQTVTVHDGTADSLVDAARHRFPRESSSVAVELESIGKVFGFFARSDQLYYGEELLVTVELLLLLQHQHEVVAEAALHHHPVDGAGQVNVGGEEHNVLALQCRDAFVMHNEVWHDRVEGALPFAARPRTRTQVRSKLADLLVIGLFGVDQRGDATIARVLARELHVRCHLLHG